MLDLQTKPLTDPSWWQRMLGRKPRQDAGAAIWNALAEHSLETLTVDVLDPILAEYRVRADDVQTLYREVYGEVLAHCAHDELIDESEERTLRELRIRFGLTSLDVVEVERAVLAPHYQRALAGSTADRKLTEAEQVRLKSLAASLRLPDSVADEIRREELMPLLESALNEAIADRRLSSEEEQQMLAVASDLGVSLTYDEPTLQKLNHFRLLWRIEQGELPNLTPGIILQRNELCHAYAGATHHEYRTVTRAVSYHGPSARVRIMRGVYWKLGHVELARHTQQVFKELGTGTLYVTSKRLLFDGSLKTTSIRLNRIIDFTVMSDGLQIQKDTGKDQFFAFSGPALEIMGVTLTALLRNTEQS